MKKISSMLALGMALALTFGMTVSAAESTTTQNPDFKPTDTQITTAEKVIETLPEVSTSTATDASGKEVTLTVKPIAAETVAELQQTTVAADTLKDLKAKGDTAYTNTIKKAMDAAVKFSTPEGKGVDPDSVKIVQTPAAAATLEIPEGTVIPSTGLQVQISLPDFKPDANKIYVVMHLGKNGWEIIAPDEISDGKVVATFKDLSPVTVNELSYVLVPLDPKPEPVGEDVNNEDEDEDDSSQAQAAAPAAANPATSPKTAETLPVAGVMALIALAGAAVCAGRIRYNK